MAAKLDPTDRWVTWMEGFSAGVTGDREGALQAIKKIESKWLGSTDLNDVGFIHCALVDLDSYCTYMKSGRPAHSAVRKCDVLPALRRGQKGPEAQGAVGKRWTGSPRRSAGPVDRSASDSLTKSGPVLRF
jgi:hypothetical protein